MIYALWAALAASLFLNVVMFGTAMRLMQGYEQQIKRLKQKISVDAQIGMV